MTKKKLLLFSCSSILIISFYLLWGKKFELSLSVQDKKIESNQRGQENFETSSLPVNKSKGIISPIFNADIREWKIKVEKNLKQQMGDGLKELTIRPLKSTIIERDDHQIPAQIVLVTLKNTDNVTTSFNALIDPQSGKVLETWNQPVFEPDFHEKN
jgi:hypothetical protein